MFLLYGKNQQHYGCLSDPPFVLNSLTKLNKYFNNTLLQLYIFLSNDCFIIFIKLTLENY